MRRRLSEPALGILGILPALILIGALILYPVAYAVWLSLLDKHSFFPTERWVGLGNYLAIARDVEFWESLWRGVVYAASTTALQLGLGVAAALVLHRSFHGRAAVRALVLFPYMVAMSVWQFTPFVIVTVLARLQTIPPELHEAARVDGAGGWARFRHITLPQIRAVLFVVILLRGIWMFTKFDTVWLWGEGAGAGREIKTLPIYAYMRTFTYYQAGFGAALAVIMFLMLMAATAVYFRLFWREESAA